MSELVETPRQRVGVGAVFVALAGLVAGVSYVLPLGFSATDSAIVGLLVLAFVVVRLVLDDSS